MESESTIARSISQSSSQRSKKRFVGGRKPFFVPAAIPVRLRFGHHDARSARGGGQADSSASRNASHFSTVAGRYVWRLSQGEARRIFSTAPRSVAQAAITASHARRQEFRSASGGASTVGGTIRSWGSLSTLRARPARVDGRRPIVAR